MHDRKAIRAARATSAATSALSFCLLLAAEPVAAGSFRGVGNMNVARVEHTATLLTNGDVLVISGTSGEIYDRESGSFLSPQSTTATRARHTATMLLDGRVLIAGGRYSGGSAEVYDPHTSTFSGTDDLLVEREEHTATLLPDGRVLVAGGTGATGPLRSTELYRPNSGGTFALSGYLDVARHQHTATLLLDGTVLVVGGHDGTAELASAQIYNPTTGAWGVAGSMSVARRQHTATLLPGGKVLITGGYDGSGYVATAELYDPGPRTFSATGALASARLGHAAAVLADGGVLITGGYSGSYPQTAERYDPTTGVFSPAGVTTARSGHTATTLPNGGVLLTGGSNGAALATAVLYGDEAAPQHEAIDMMSVGRQGHTATALRFGHVLLAGGDDAAGSGSADLTDGATMLPRTMVTPRAGHTATYLVDGRVLIAGGSSGGSLVGEAEVYGLDSTFTPAATMNVPRENATATLLRNGLVLITGGYGATGSLASAELYDPGSDTFLRVRNMQLPRSRHTATLLSNGLVLIVGGTVGDTPAELYDPASRSFALFDGTLTARRGHTATLLESGKVLIAGGADDPGDVAILYDWQTAQFTATGTLVEDRSHHTATRLADGTVLLAGGSRFGAHAATEIYDPVTGTFSAATPLLAARAGHTAALLPDGKVLLTGGVGYMSGAQASAELYEPRPLVSSRQPVINGASMTTASDMFAGTLQGSRFRGNLEGGSSGTNSSASNVPVLALRRLDNQQMSGAHASSWSDTEFHYGPIALAEGWYRGAIATNGIASDLFVAFNVDYAGPIITNAPTGGPTSAPGLLSAIAGQHLENARVYLGNDAALVMEATDTMVTFFPPPGEPGTVTLSVETPGGMAVVDYDYYLPPPQFVQATAMGSGSVTIHWAAVAGAVEYAVERSGNASTWSPVAMTSSTETIDATTSSGSAYLYRVRAINGSHESVSNPDLATNVSYSDAAIEPGMFFMRRHITETRTAVDAVRALAGLGGGTFLDPVIAAGSSVKAQHVLDLRGELQDALTALSLPAASYSRTPAPGRTVHALDIQQVRNALR